MTNFEKHIENAGKEYSLSHDEKARMQRVIKSYMRFKPLRGEAASTSYSFSWFMYLQRPIAASLVMVLIFGSGISFAAENALPGDVLYNVKTGVNEPLRVALATDAEAKAEVQMEIAERRIEEATYLSAEGRLDDSTQDELAASFKSYAAAVSESIEATASEDTAASLELAARFENRLIAHESVLAEVEIELENEDEALHSTRFSDAIRATNEVLAEARFNRGNVALGSDAGIAASIEATDSSDASATMQAEPAMMAMKVTAPSHTSSSADEARGPASAPSASGLAEAPRASSPDARSISRMKNAAEKSLKTTERSLRKAKLLSTEAKARAEADIELAGDLIENGEDYLDDEYNAEAYAAFAESLRVSEQANVFLKAAPTLEKARSRNASRTSARNDSDSDAGKSSTKIMIETPAATINATIDATITVPTTSPPDRSDDDSNHDDDRGSDDDDHSDDRKDKDEPGLINSFLKNISL